MGEGVIPIPCFPIESEDGEVYIGEHGLGTASSPINILLLLVPPSLDGNTTSISLGPCPS